MTEDKNGVRLSVGMRVLSLHEDRPGTVQGLVGPYRVLVLFEGDQDDQLVKASELVTASRVSERRRR